MPKEKEFKLDIPSLYKKSAEDLLMFGWIYGQKQIVPSVSIKKSIELFMNFCNLSEDEFSVESAEIIFNRMNKQFLFEKKIT